jgi:hypothetical protein
MKTLSREEGGWALARCWLAALEETARDFLGTQPKLFCERGYEHATARWIEILDENYGITAEKARTVKEAIEHYIDLCVKGGLFRDASQFELAQANPQRVNIKAVDCPYRQTCEALLEGGFTIRDLSCARIGCFRAAAEHLSGIPCKYEVTAFQVDGCCVGYIEHR